VISATRSSRNTVFFSGLVFLVLLLAAGAWLRRISVRPVRTLPRLGQFPVFALSDASGGARRTADLRGSIWIAGSISPSCASCAVAALKMADLQTSFEKARGVLLVSFVSDPALEDPPRLSELSREFGAKPGRWIFLAGSPGSIPEGRVVVVDESGEIRGNFDVASAEFSSELLDSVGDLMREGRAR